MKQIIKIMRILIMSRNKQINIRIIINIFKMKIKLLELMLLLVITKLSLIKTKIKMTLIKMVTMKSMYRARNKHWQRKRSRNRLLIKRMVKSQVRNIDMYKKR